MLILLILIIDQALKFWVKTHMPLSEDWDQFHAMLTPYDRGIRRWEGVGSRFIL